MLMILSPAKTLDFATPSPPLPASRPQFLREARAVVTQMRDLDAAQLGRLMHISPDLAALNEARFRSWSTRPAARNTRPAVLAFRGDVYLGLCAETFDATQMQFAQSHLRILSGLYGLLRPLDLIQAYRLEMGTQHPVGEAANLYRFWGTKLGKALAAQADELGSTTLINLASQEYFRALDLRQSQLRVITPVFKERRGGVLKIVSFSAKRARGLMAGFAIRNAISDPVALRDFREEGYRFQPRLSDEREWVFSRTAPKTIGGVR